MIYVFCKYCHSKLSPDQTRKIIFNDLTTKDQVTYPNVSNGIKRTVRHANYILIEYKGAAIFISIGGSGTKFNQGI